MIESFQYSIFSEQEYIIALVKPLPYPLLTNQLPLCLLLYTARLQILAIMKTYLRLVIHTDIKGYTSHQYTSISRDLVTHVEKTTKEIYKQNIDFLLSLIVNPSNTCPKIELCTN